MFAGENIIVLDLEIANRPETVEGGWRNPLGLGLSIGAYYDYTDGMVHWFDEANLIDTILHLSVREPIYVSFNGIQFDFALMFDVAMSQSPDIIDHELLKPFSDQTSGGPRCYDILDAIWRADPEGKGTKGLNSLDAILAANKLGQKTGDGASAPAWWAEGKRAQVMNYCQQDVLLTKRLFEYISSNYGLIQRSNGPLQIEYIGPVTCKRFETPLPDNADMHWVNRIAAEVRQRLQGEEHTP